MNEAIRTRIFKPAGVAVRYAIGAVFGLWLGDLAVLVESPEAVSPKQWIRGVGSALFVALTTALALGSLLGPVLVPALTRAAQALRTWWRGIVREDGAPRALAALALTIIFLLPASGLCVYYAAFALEFEFARPASIAAALTVSHFVFVAVLGVAWLSGLRLARAAVRVGSEVPALDWVTARSWRVWLTFALWVFSVAGAFALTHRQDLSAVRWSEAIPIVAILPGLVVAASLGKVSRPWRGRLTLVAYAFVAGGLVVGGVVAAGLHPESSVARRLAFERFLSGRAGYAVWTAALDFDGDGQINVLGGGDCAPFDPKRHTGAIDIPGNGIDEDCDGIDQPRTFIRPRPRLSVGQNALPRHPTIVLVTIDALAAPRLVTLGSHISYMPNLDELATHSELFTHCFSQGPSTRLSMPSMFTSRWDSQLALDFAPRYPYPLAASERQLQDLLDTAGYETSAVIPNEYFDQKHWATMTRGFQRVDASALPFGRGNAPQVTDAALRVLSAVQERPLYLWVHYYDAHAPYAPLPGVTYTRHTEEAYYEAQLAHIDHELGRLFAAIEARPEPLYLIVSADHATVFHPNPLIRRAHYGFDLYTATLHVPLIVHGPGLAPGRIDGVVSTMDILPTIADLLQLPESATLQGTSLFPEMLGSRSDPDRSLFHEFYLPERDFRGEDPLAMVSVRNGTYNLVLDRVRGRYELFDWTKDYFEMHDLFEDNARTPEVLSMRSLLSTFVQQFHRRAPGAALLPPPGATPNP